MGLRGVHRATFDPGPLGPTGTKDGPSTQWNGIAFKQIVAPDAQSAPEAPSFHAPNVNVRGPVAAAAVHVGTPEEVQNAAMTMAKVHEHVIRMHAHVFARLMRQKASRLMSRRKGKKSRGGKAVASQFALACIDGAADYDHLVAMVTALEAGESSDNDGEDLPWSPDDLAKQLRNVLDDANELRRRLAPLVDDPDQDVLPRDPRALQALIRTVVDDPHALMALLGKAQGLPSLGELHGAFRGDLEEQLAQFRTTDEGVHELQLLNTATAAQESGNAEGFVDTYAKLPETEGLWPTFKLVIERFGIDGLLDGIRLLMSALAEDISAYMPSIEREHLREIHDRLGNLKILNTLRDRAKRVAADVNKAWDAAIETKAAPTAP